MLSFPSSMNQCRIMRVGMLTSITLSMELREHEHLVSSFKRGIKEPLEDHHLPARVDELLIHDRLLHLCVERPAKQEGCEHTLRNCMTTF